MKEIKIKKSFGYLLYKFKDNDKPIVVQKATLLEDDDGISENFQYVIIINKDYGNRRNIEDDPLWTVYGYEKDYEVKDLGDNLDKVKKQYSMYFI